MHRPLALLAACSLALPAVALADAVPSPPDDCPDGSHGRTGHAGPWCNPTTCATNADCREEGTACREAALCIESEQYRMGGWAGDEQATREVAHGPCNADGQCTAGDCRRAKYCMRTGGDTSAGSDSDSDSDAEESAPPEEQPPEKQPPTTMDTADERAPGGATKQPSEQGGDAEEEDDGGCAATGARRAPVWALAPLLLAAMARRRRER